MTKPQHEQDYETLKSALDSAPTGRWTSFQHNHALTRLHSEAAKVPGLEADNAAIKEQATKVLYVAIGLHALYRSDSRVESDGSHEALFAETHRLLSGAHPGAALLERLAKAESERDAARQEVARLNERVDGLTDSLKASLANTEEEQEANKRLADGLASAADDAASLRERVATLEEELATLTASEQGADAVAKEALAAERTAEARVKELEAKLAGARNAALEEAASEVHKLLDTPAVGLSKRMALTEAESNIRALTSQPPPAPAKGERSALEKNVAANAQSLDKARVVEVLRAKHDAAEDVASVSEDADSDTHALQVDLIRETVESIAGDLGLTLDVGGGK